MSISTGSASASLTRDRRLQALRALERAVDGRDARPLQEVVGDNLRQLWKNGGKRGDDKPGLRPVRIWIRDEFVSTLAEDAHGSALPRLIQSKGLQLRLYLLMLFDAQCRHETGSTVRNVRPVSPSNDPPTGPGANWSCPPRTTRTSSPCRGRRSADAVSARSRRRWRCWRPSITCWTSA